MLLTIDHLTDYAYGSPSAHSVQYVRLTPRSECGQKVVSWHMDGPGRSAAWRDGFGNIVHCLVRTEAHDRLQLRVGGQVETSETHGIVPEDHHGLPPGAYLRATPLTEPDQRVRDFASRFQRLRAKGDLVALHALMAGIHETVAYQPGSSNVASKASEALARGSGVCQDHAHLFIACCRAWGIPARYVSGYLHSDAEDGLHLATHAWAEAMVDYLGWVSFDPTNRQSATRAYVRLAVGLDYQGAAPVRGMRLGGGHEEMSVSVQIDHMADQ